jgi:hypothetical protein
MNLMRLLEGLHLSGRLSSPISQTKPCVKNSVERTYLFAIEHEIYSDVLPELCR